MSGLKEVHISRNPDMYEEACLITVKLSFYFLFFVCFLGNSGDVG